VLAGNTGHTCIRHTFHKFARLLKTVASILTRTDAALYDGADEYTDNRGDPEQPELCHRPVTNEQHHTRAACGVHRGIAYRDADQVYQRQAQADGDRGEVPQKPLD